MHFIVFNAEYKDTDNCVKISHSPWKWYNYKSKNI